MTARRSSHRGCWFAARATDGFSWLVPRFTATDCPENMTTVMMVMVDLTEMAMMDDGENDVEMC